MNITDDMIRKRAKDLAIKYEDNVNAWQKYYSLAAKQLDDELRDAPELLRR